MIGNRARDLGEVVKTEHLGATPMITRASLTFALVAMSFAAAEAFAEPNKEQYDLQERCGKRAEQVFKSDNPGQSSGSLVTNTEDGSTITTYQNHYSAALNKCFYLIITTGIHSKENPQYTTTFVTIINLNENKEYGSFFKRSLDSAPVMCNLRQQVCHSQGEWEELLKPYMEE
jgi:hypothetical protein